MRTQASFSLSLFLSDFPLPPRLCAGKWHNLFSVSGGSVQINRAPGKLSSSPPSSSVAKSTKQENWEEDEEEEEEKGRRRSQLSAFYGPQIGCGVGCGMQQISRWRWLFYAANCLIKLTASQNLMRFNAKIIT